MYDLEGSNGQHSRRASHALHPDGHGAVPSITCTRAETHELASGASGATSHRRLSEHPTPGKLPKRPRARSTTIELAQKVRLRLYIFHFLLYLPFHFRPFRLLVTICNPVTRLTLGLARYFVLPRNIEYFTVD